MLHTQIFMLALEMTLKLIFRQIGAKVDFDVIFTLGHISPNLAQKWFSGLKVNL